MCNFLVPFILTYITDLNDRLDKALGSVYKVEMDRVGQPAVQFAEVRCYGCCNSAVQKVVCCFQCPECGLVVFYRYTYSCVEQQHRTMMAGNLAPSRTHYQGAAPALGLTLPTISPVHAL